MGERVGQRGSSDRPREALGAAEIWRSASAVGGGAYLLLVGTEPPYEQGLRTVSRDERGVRLRGDESLDGEAFSSHMRLFRQFQVGILGTSHIGVLGSLVQANRANRAPSRAPMPTATAMLCLWTCPPLRARAILLVEAVDATVWTAEASVGVRHLLHAGDLPEQLAPRGLHRG